MNVGGFEFPDDVGVLVEHDVWARVHDDGTATVGITSLGVRLSGEIYMCRAKPVGTEVARGRAIAVVELAKAIVSVRSPVTGRVVAVNPLLGTRPEAVHADPYGDGWIVRLHRTDPDDDDARLVRGDALAAAIGERLRLERLDRG